MPPQRAVSFREALRVWLYVGIHSFGGPAGQIATMHRVVVEEKRWLSEERFLHALNYCMLLPGPEAQQLSIYIGWLMHGRRGGLAAGILFVLPGALVMLGLSMLYATAHDVTWFQALFFGIKCAVLAVVFEAVMRIGKRALKNAVAWSIAALSFTAICFCAVPFPWIVVAALGIGFVGGKLGLRSFQSADSSHARAKQVGASSADDAIGSEMPPHTRPSAARAARTLAIGLFAWILPLVAVSLIFGRDSVFARQGLFFSETAIVTFGGAYAVLAYVSKVAVDAFGWMKPGEMVDGLGLAETTPGPLILVLQFVGFLGAHRLHGDVPPMLAGVIGSCVTLWATFAPCFLWIFLGAPWIESLRTNRALSSALSTVTAAVVGVILNLAVWFALHVLFAHVEETRHFGLRVWEPEWSTLDPWALALGIFALVALLRFKVPMLVVIGSCALAGLALHFAR
jgi:chromate transporter